jgi:hypothetical protein
MICLSCVRFATGDPHGTLTELLAHRYVAQCFISDDQTFRISFPHDVLVLIGMVEHRSQA